MLKSYSKLILVSIIVFIVVITVIVVISFTRKPLTSANPYSLSPTSPAETVSEDVAPSLVPVSDFTGAEETQTLPPEVQTVGEQKTALRRLTPLELDFAVIEFDYENDQFLVQLFDPVEESKLQFNNWKIQNYPALKDEQFIIN